MDAKSKWIEVLPMSSTTAEATVEALRFVRSAPGLFEEIVSDNCPHWIAQEFIDCQVQSYQILFECALSPCIKWEGWKSSEDLQASHEGFKAQFWYLGKEDMLISVELPLYSAHCYWMYASNAQILGRKLPSQTSCNLVHQRDNWLLQIQFLFKIIGKEEILGTEVSVSKLGPLIPCASFFRKRHIDQLKHLSGTKLPFPRQWESKAVLPQALASSSITESIPSSDYTPVTGKPNSELAMPLPEQGSSLTFPNDEESATQEEPHTLTRHYPQRERRPSECLIEQKWWTAGEHLIFVW